MPLVPAARLFVGTSSRRAISFLLSSLQPRAAAVGAPRVQEKFWRNYASVVTIPRTKVTTLDNGFTVATEAIPHAETATVGVWIDAGSRAESQEDNGAAHFLEHMAFKGTNTRTQRALEMEVEDMGGHLNAYTSREQTVYYAKSFKDDVPRVVDILSDILQNSKLEDSAVERERDVILREQKEIEKNTEEVVFDHLHAVAFPASSLGFTILGSEKNIKSLKRNDLNAYIKKNYTADRMVLAAAGGVDHERLVQYARSAFGTVPNGHGAHRLGVSPVPKFTGAELRITDETALYTHVALAVESVGWNSADFFPMLVIQNMVGSWDRTCGVTDRAYDRLPNVSARRNLCKSYSAFNTSYTDTGIFGMYVITDNTRDMTELVELSFKEWTRLAAPDFHEIEVQRAKQQLKASLLLGLDGTTPIAEDIGRQVVTSGKYVPPDDVAILVDRVTPQDVQRVAQQYLRNRPVSVVAIGQVAGLPTHRHM